MTVLMETVTEIGKGKWTPVKVSTVYTLSGEKWALAPRSITYNTEVSAQIIHLHCILYTNRFSWAHSISRDILV